jgi:hypothetical protein
VQRLTQLEADHAGTDHGNRCGQIGPVEYVVVDDEAIPEFSERIGISHSRSRRNDDALRRDALVIADDKRVVVLEARVTTNAIRFRDAFDIPQHEAYEAVAFAPHPRHDFAPFDADPAVEMRAETRQKLCRMHGLGRGDQELARHAADARAGRSVLAAFDQHD